MSHHHGPTQGQQPRYGQQAMHTQPGYPQPPAGPPAVKGGNGVGVAALLLGVLAGGFAFAPAVAPLGFLLGLVAVGLAGFAIVRVATRKADSMIIAVVALIVSLAAIVAIATLPQLLHGAPATQEDVTECLNDPATDTADEIFACAD